MNTTYQSLHAMINIMKQAYHKSTEEEKRKLLELTISELCNVIMNCPASAIERKTIVEMAMTTVDTIRSERELINTRKVEEIICSKL